MHTIKPFPLLWVGLGFTRKFVNTNVKRKALSAVQFSVPEKCPKEHFFLILKLNFALRSTERGHHIMCRALLFLTRADFIRLFPVYPSGGAEGFPPKHTSAKASLQRPVLCDPTALLSPGLVDFIVPQGKLFSFRQQLIS